MLGNALERFLSFRRPNTRNAYSKALADLCSFLGYHDTDAAEAALRKLSADKAMAYLADLKRRPVPDGGTTSDNTLRLRYFALRSMYQHLSELGIIGRNPWAVAGKIISSRQQTQKRPTQLVPFDLVHELLTIPNARTKNGVRDRAMLALLFGCGLRRSELVGLNVADVKVSPKGTLFIELSNTKAGKRRQQPLPRWAGESFSALVSQRKAEHAIDGDPLFPFYYADGRARERYSVESLYRLFRKYCKQLGIKAAPHAARATAATRLLDQGYHDRDVAQFLGHSTTGMVEIYDKRRRDVEQNCGKTLIFP